MYGKFAKGGGTTRQSKCVNGMLTHQLDPYKLVYTEDLEKLIGLTSNKKNKNLALLQPFLETPQLRINDKK